MVDGVVKCSHGGTEAAKETRKEFGLMGRFPSGLQTCQGWVQSLSFSAF
jgi:hypothetical protein